jgi:hypothetical protein
MISPAMCRRRLQQLPKHNNLIFLLLLLTAQQHQMVLSVSPQSLRLCLKSAHSCSYCSYQRCNFYRGYECTTGSNISTFPSGQCHSTTRASTKQSTCPSRHTNTCRSSYYFASKLATCIPRLLAKPLLMAHSFTRRRLLSPNARDTTSPIGY